jgi:hypothetical protein
VKQFILIQSSYKKFTESQSDMISFDNNFLVLLVLALLVISTHRRSTVFIIVRRLYIMSFLFNDFYARTQLL